MSYKFEDLEVWQRALDYADTIHDIANELPKHERYTLIKDRGRRSADGSLFRPETVATARKLLPENADGVPF